MLIQNIEKKYSQLLVDYVAQQSSNKMIADTQDKLLNKMQMLEMRMDAQPKNQAPIVMPNKVSLQMDKPMELKWPAQAVQIINREGPPVKYKKKQPTPLLDKAGITSRKASEAAAKRAADLNQLAKETNKMKKRPLRICMKKKFKTIMVLMVFQ